MVRKQGRLNCDADVTTSSLRRDDDEDTGNKIQFSTIWNCVTGFFLTSLCLRRFTNCCCRFPQISLSPTLVSFSSSFFSCRGTSKEEIWKSCISNLFCFSQMTESQIFKKFSGVWTRARVCDSHDFLKPLRFFQAFLL